MNLHHIMTLNKLFHLGFLFPFGGQHYKAWGFSPTFLLFLTKVLPKTFCHVIKLLAFLTCVTSLCIRPALPLWFSQGRLLSSSSGFWSKRGALHIFFMSVTGKSHVWGEPPPCPRWCAVLEFTWSLVLWSLGMNRKVHIMYFIGSSETWNPIHWDIMTVMCSLLLL